MSTKNVEMPIRKCGVAESLPRRSRTVAASDDIAAELYHALLTAAGEQLRRDSHTCRTIMTRQFAPRSRRPAPLEHLPDPADGTDEQVREPQGERGGEGV